MRATMTILIACLLLAGGPALAAATAADAAAADTTKAAADTSGHGKDKGVGPVEHVELGALNKQLAERGKNLFDNHCTVCHALDKKKIGPPLGHAFDQRTPEFIMNMILNAPQMEQNDPVVAQLKAQYMVAMPQLGLQRPQARAILEYLREQAGGQAEDPPRRDAAGTARGRWRVTGASAGRRRPVGGGRMLRFLRERRRRRLRARPFPGAWRDIVERNVPLYRCLPPADRRELRGDIQVFLAEKHFEGCGGLAMTDEIRVTVAAQACLLLLHRRHDDYPGLVSILVYPSAYVARMSRPLPGGVVSDELSVRLGEAWTRGAVVLSWDDVRRGASDVHDGQNVVLHEFAHQLDQESGAVDGAPALERPSMYVAWARILGAAYQALRRDVAAERPTVLSGYAATNPAEFFAVATECFFEKPAALAAAEPELYEELKLFYRQDPLTYRQPCSHVGPDRGGSSE